MTSAAEPARRGANDEAARYRRLEREWQNDVGYTLLDKPYETPGSAAVFRRQFDRLIALIDPAQPGCIVEIGCGKGHFLRRLREVHPALARRLVGIDLSRAIFSLPPHDLAGVQADAECLPFRDGGAAGVIYDGALHHCIDYPEALREAIRILAPGGRLIIFEPVSSRFSRLVHRLLDPIVFRRAVVYESPIDVRYKAGFHQSIVTQVLRQQGLAVRESRSEFLAYPLTGCYAGSIFARRERFMRWLMTAEDWVAATPVLNRLAASLCWRFTIVAMREGRSHEPLRR